MTKIVIPIDSSTIAFENVIGFSLIQRVLDNLPSGEIIFVINPEDASLISDSPPDTFTIATSTSSRLATVVSLEAPTAGPACMVLEGVNHLPDDISGEDVIVSTPDQLIEWNPEHFVAYMKRGDADGGIVTYRGYQSKRPFVNVLTDGTVAETSESSPIGHDNACGVYYFANPLILENAILQMIAKEKQTSGKFCLAPVFNEMIIDGMKILNYPVPKMHDNLDEIRHVYREKGIF